MQTINYERNFWATEEKPPGLYRILCLGDSLAYGSGVLPEESLPAHLETILNPATWNSQIEVINGAVSGFSIYDDWHHYIHYRHRYKPDLVIFILCDNDIELFNISTLHAQDIKISYQEHVTQCWEEGSIHYQNALLGLKSIGSQLKEQNIPVITAFYSVHEPDSIKTMISTLENASKDNNICFVDLSVDFTGTSSSSYNENYKVSQADGHPSNIAHRIAAKRLSRYIVDKELIKSTHADYADEMTLYNNFINHAIEMHNTGYNSEYIYYYLINLISSKHSSKVRLKLDSDKMIEESEYEKLISSLAALSSQHYNILYLEAYFRLLSNNLDALYTTSNNADSLVNLISKALFVLCNYLNKQTPSYVKYSFPHFDNYDPNSLKSTPLLLAGWSEKLDSLKQFVGSISHGIVPEKYSQLSYFTSLTEDRHRNITNRVKRYCTEYDRLLCSLYCIYNSYIEVIDKSKSFTNPVIEYVRSIENAIYQLLLLAKNEALLLNLDNIKMPSSDKQKDPMTVCSIKISSKSDDTFGIWAYARSIIPENRPFTDMQWAISDGHTHTYRFKFPLLFLGEVRFSLETQSETTIEEIQIYNNPEHKTIIGISNLKDPKAKDLMLTQVLLAP